MLQRDGFQLTCWLYALLTGWYRGSCGFVFYVPSEEICRCNEFFLHESCILKPSSPSFPSLNDVWMRTTRLTQIDESSISTRFHSLHPIVLQAQVPFSIVASGGSPHSSILVKPPVNAVHFPRVHFLPMILRFERISSSFMSPTITDVAGMAWNPLEMHSDT